MSALEGAASSPSLRLAVPASYTGPVGRGRRRGMGKHLALDGHVGRPHKGFQYCRRRGHLGST